MAQKFLTNLDLNKNELQNAKVQNLGTAPTSPEDGQIYFDTVDNALKIYNGTSWDAVASGDITGVTAGTGLSGGGASGDVTLNIDTTGVTASTYGSGTAVPVITVNAQGQITAASTSAISTTLDIAADSGTDDGVVLGTDTLTFTGGTGVTTSVSGDAVTFAIGQDVGTGANVTFNSVTASLTGTATNATNVISSANDATNETVYLTFVDGQTGAQGIETDLGLTYNPSTGVLTTTSVTGNLTGAVTGNVTGNVTGDLTGDVTGNADTATTLATGRTIALSGDVTATGVSFDGSANITLSTTIAANSVALGTDTTGDYVDSLVAGTGVTLTNNTGEGATPTVAIGQAVGTSDNVTFNNLTVSGDLTVSGATTTVNTATLSVEDPLIVLASGNNATDAVDIGFYGLYDSSGSQDLYAGFFRDASDGKFRLFKDTQAEPTTTVDTGGTGYAVATLVANLEGNVTGDVTGNADTATALETARTIGGVSFDGTANISLPGVDTTGNQDTSGNAASATALETARTINGVSFDGTANITVTAAAGTLTGTTLNSSVVTSSLTTVGTIGTGTWNGDTIAVAYGGTGATTAAGAKTNLGFVGRYAATIGDNTNTSIAVTHNFGTDDVVVEVYDATSKETVVCDVDRTSTNAVTLTFASAPALNALRVVVIG